MPIVPPAPPVLSTMTVWPRVLVIDSPIRRATVSVGPPAAAGTTSVIGLFGEGRLGRPQCRRGGDRHRQNGGQADSRRGTRSKTHDVLPTGFGRSPP